MVSGRILNSFWTQGSTGSTREAVGSPICLLCAFLFILFVFSVDHGSTFRDGSSCEISFGTAKLECYAHSGLVPARVLDV